MKKSTELLDRVMGVQPELFSPEYMEMFGDISYHAKIVCGKPYLICRSHGWHHKMGVPKVIRFYATEINPQSLRLGSPFYPLPDSRQFFSTEEDLIEAIEEYIKFYNK